MWTLGLLLVAPIVNLVQSRRNRLKKAQTVDWLFDYSRCSPETQLAVPINSKSPQQ
ncbi:hypothetical protein WKK05_36555 (plasmid) [Nostoc sp. UHCC 0302]|uniref:hypothetical protein n=1 Tax=Nostoc sp. UHCC 0302 TaxID=3134896 RepID=UPI00311C89A2